MSCTPSSPCGTCDLCTDTAIARIVRVSDVKPERVSWLWRGYIPRGKLTLIDGDPGDGKSTLSLDLAARLSTGSPMPDGQPGILGNVLVLSAEDGIGDTIRPRLDAAGADTQRVMVLHEIVEEGQARPPELPLDLGHLARLIREHNITLVIIDPLMAFLAGVDSHNDQSVRRALHPLAKLADATGAAVLVIRHLNKGSGKALYRGGGSIGISGAARAVFLVAADPEDEGRRLLASVKVNIAVKPPTMAYRVVGDELHGCSRIQWEGVVEASADELVNVEPAEDRAEKLTATDYLIKALEGGPRLTREIEEEALQIHGISQRTLFRARKFLQVRAEQMATGRQGRNEWWLSLPTRHRAEAGCQADTPSEWHPGSLPTQTPAATVAADSERTTT